MTISYLLIQFLDLSCTLFYGTCFTLLFLDIALSRKNIIRYVIFMSLEFLLQGFILIYFSWTMTTYLYPFSVHIPVIFLCLFVYKKKLFSILSSVFFCCFLILPKMLCSNVLLWVLPGSPYIDHLSHILAAILLFFFTWYLILPPIRKIMTREKQSIQLLFLPLLIIYLLIFFLFIYTDALLSYPHLTMEIMVTIFFFLILYYMYLYYVTCDKTYSLALKNQMLEASAHSILLQTRIIQDSYDEMRKVREDIAAFSASVEQAVTSGDMEKVHSYTDSLSLSFQGKTPYYCQNRSVNLLLVAYLQPFIDQQIPMEVQVNLPVAIPYDEMDICTLIANALENAYQACKQEPMPFLHVEINNLPDKLFMKIANSCEHPVPFRNGIPYTDRTGHGLGTKSIAAIAEKYHGLALFSLKQQAFILQIILHVPNSNPRKDKL